MTAKFIFLWTLAFLPWVAGSQAAPPVKAVYAADGAPASWEESGRAQGYEPEIVAYCLGKMGLQVVHQFLPWARAQLAVESGEADLMVTTPTEERFQYGLFGKEKLVLVEFKLFTSKDNKALIEKAAQFTKLEDLRPYTIADYPGNGWSASYLKQEDGYKILKSYQIDQIPLVLRAHRADFAMNFPALIHAAEEATETRKEIAEIAVNMPHTKFHYVFIVSRKSPWAAKGLVKGLDQALAEMKSSGEWVRIFARYRESPGDEKTFRSEIDTGPFYTGYDSYPDFHGVR